MPQLLHFVGKQQRQLESCSVVINLCCTVCMAFWISLHFNPNQILPSYCLVILQKGLYIDILANFQISERGTNERKKCKKRNIPKFPIHYYTKIAAKTGTHDKIILFFASKRGTVPPKEEQLASMHWFQWLLYCNCCKMNNYVKFYMIFFQRQFGMPFYC